jgi:ApeA N-terminal domain 1
MRNAAAGPQPLRDDRAMATTSSDLGSGLRGRFWLQGNREAEAIPGRLFLRSGAHPLLELDEALTPLMRKTSRTKLPDGREVVKSSPVPPQELASQSLTIHGALETGELVTLPSAFTAGWTERGTGYKSHRLQSFYTLLGDHVDGTDALFASVRVRIRHLDAWANLSGFKIDPGPTDRSWTLAYEPPKVPSATLASGARISIEQVATISSPSSCGGRLERNLWLDVLGIAPTTYRELGRKVVVPLMNLLSFAVGKECPLVEMAISAGPDHPWLTVQNDSMKAAAEEIVPLPLVLLPMAEIGLQGVAMWLDSTASLGPLPAVIARVVNSQDDPLEAQLLELTSAAEGLHRLLQPGQKRMTKKQASEARVTAVEAVKELDEDVRGAVEAAWHHLTDPSYPRRLLDLAEQVKGAVPGVTGDTQEWKKRVSNARNGLAHKLERGFLDDDIDAQEYAALLLSLGWLLTGLLLLQTGIRPTALGNRLRSYEPYQLFLSQARALLPAVYSSEGPT